MDIRILRYFLAVARLENITKAADYLHITQPSLSKQIMELEAEVGKQLLIRGTRKVTLTEDGIFLSKRAEEIVSLFEKTEREIMSDSDQIQGTVSIGGGTNAASMMLLQATADLNEKYPGIVYDLSSGDAVTVTEKLDHGLLDFAILIEPVDVVKYDFISLPVTSRFGLLMKSDYPLAEKPFICPEDLNKLPLILPKRLELQRQLSQWSGTDLENFNITGTFDVAQNASLLVKYGRGCALSLEKPLDSKNDYDLCFRPFLPAMEVRYCLVWKRFQVFSKASKKFLEAVRDAVESTSGNQ